MTQFYDFNADKRARYNKIAQELLSQKGWPRYFTFGYYSEDLGDEVFDFSIPLTVEQYKRARAIVEECKSKEVPLSEYFCDNDAPEFMLLEREGFFSEPWEINLDEAYYPCSVKMAIFYDGIDQAPQVVERRIVLSHSEYLELLEWQLACRNASYNDLCDAKPQMFKAVDGKLRMAFAADGVTVMPYEVPVFAAELTGIKEDALLLCGEGELQREIYYRDDEDFVEHTFVDIEDRLMRIFFEHYDYSGQKVVQAHILEDIDAVAVEQALGVDSYAGIADSLSVYFGSRDGVARFAEFLRSKSIDFVENVKQE